MIFVIVLVVVISIIVLLLVAGNYYSKKRQREWSEFARNHNFSYAKDDAIGLPAQYAEFPLFQIGDKKTAMNICQGKEKEFDICAFDYFRQDRHVGIFRYTVMALESELLFKSLSIHPKYVAEKTGIGSQHILTSGSDNISFESAEFSNKFYIQCADKKFAYAIIHPRMMEFLLANNNIHIEMGSKTIIFYRETQQLTTQEMDNLLQFAYRIFELIPDYVREDISILS
jgi:hypothetical protein